MDAFSTSVTIKALYLVLLLSAPPVLAAMVIGLIISLLQATTQVQEQTLTFVPKIIAIIITIIVTASWMMDLMITFTTDVFAKMTHFVR